MRVTEHYAIHGDVPFLNIHLERDNKLYLDPSAIRNDHGPRARQAQDLLETFFDNVMRFRRSHNPEDQRHGRAMLSGLQEPNENRLGSSRQGVGGHAIGPGIADDLWDVLANNPAAVSAALRRIEDLPLFITNVGNDLISDLTTRVIYPVLAQFTMEMTQLYPQLSRHTTTERIGVYNTQDQAWEERPFTLPFAFDRQILLVPQNWVYWRMLMHAGAFYNNFSTATVQEEREWVDGTGQVRHPSKAELKEEFPDRKQLNTDRAAFHIGEGRDLVAEYRTRVDGEFQPLTDDELLFRSDQ